MMKKLSVLFYLEPWTENKKPWFRHFPIRAVFNRISKAVNDSEGETSLVCGEGAHFTIHEKGWGLENFQTQTVIKESDLRNLCNNYNEFAHLDQNNPKKIADHVNKINPELSKKKYDIVFVWESCAEYLKLVIKADRYVFLSPGMLSRNPYPYHVTVDTCGTFAKSWLGNIAKQDIDKFCSTSNEPVIEPLLDSAEFYIDTQQKKSVPIEIRKKIAKFSKTYCLPLQISDYFATNNQLTGSKQWDFLIRVLNAAPVDVGIVVTHYMSLGLEEQVILRDNINFLESRYPNLIFSEQIDTIESASQSILPLVDGVITISSSVGLQAKIQGKELIAISKSHLSAVSDGGLKDISREIKKKNGKHIDFLKALHGRYFLPTGLIFKNTASIEKFLNTILKQKDREPPRFFSNTELREYYENEAGNIQKKIYSEDAIAPAPTHATTILERLASEKFKVVSFDIFDTLIQREIFTPAAVFDLIENTVENSEYSPQLKKLLRTSGFSTYRALRMESEHIARKNLAVFNFEDCNFDEIYEQIATHSESTSFIQYLKDLEVKIELDVICQRRHGKLLYDLARASGKKIIFTSDMYLPHSIILQILQKNGLYNDENIYVSSEIRLRKHSGNLFLHIIRDLNISPKEIYHIGDAEHGDYMVPKKFGISTSLVPAARDYWKYTYGNSYRKNGAENLTEEVIFGGQAMQVYDFPYHATQNNGYFRGRAEFFGYAVAGPLMVGLSEWLAKNINDKKIDRVFFFSRDGFVAKKVFESTYRDSVKIEKCEYVHVSRRVLAIAAIHDHDDIIALTKQRFEPLALEEFIRIRFGVDLWSLTEDEKFDLLKDTKINDITDVISTATNIKDLTTIVRRLESYILAHAQSMRGNVIQYLDQLGLRPEVGKNTAIFDIGYSASLQRYIEKIYGVNFITGLYFATFVGIKALFEQGGKAFGYAGENIDTKITKHQYVHAVHIFETLFSHIAGSTFNYSTAGDQVKPILTDEQHFHGKNYFVSNLWSGIDEFLSTFKKYRHLIDWTQFNWEKALKPFDDFTISPAADDLYLFDDVKFENLYCGEGAAPIVNFSNSNEKVLWMHGQRAIQNHRGTYQNCMRHLQDAKPFESLEDYIKMIYENSFIRNLIKYQNEKNKIYEQSIEILEIENSKLKAVVEKVESKGSEIQRDYLMSISISSDGLLDGIEKWFSEEDYMKANPDVAIAVEAGEIESGLAHFKLFGHKEGRQLF